MAALSFLFCIEPPVTIKHSEKRSDFLQTDFKYDLQIVALEDNDWKILEKRFLGEWARFRKVSSQDLISCRLLGT